MSEPNWKEKIIKDRLGGKTEWTDAERVELCQRLDQDMEDRFDQLIRGKNISNTEESTSSKSKDSWTPDNFQEKMAEHPFFTPFVQDCHSADVEVPDNPLTEGLAQLKFSPDHNSPQEMAQNYKEEGVHHFKYKRYRLAVSSFSEGLRAKCTDSELLAQLLNNRAAAHYRLGNFRAAIRDCEQAITLKPGYRKAIARAAESADRLGLWDELVRWADMGLGLDPDDSFFVELRLAAIHEQNKVERITRKKTAEENKRLLQMKQLLEVIEEHGVTLEPRDMETVPTEDKDGSKLSPAEKELASLPDLTPSHPSAQGSKVHQNKAGDLVWPVLLLYPEYQLTDFIQHFNEKHTFVEQLEVVFGEGSPPAPWDKQRQYSLPRLALYFEDRANNKLVPVTITNTLRDTLADNRCVVRGGTPSFIIAVAGSKFLQTFITNYD